MRRPRPLASTPPEHAKLSLHAFLAPRLGPCQFCRLQDPARYVARDPEMAQTLLDQRQAGEHTPTWALSGGFADPLVRCAALYGSLHGRGLPTRLLPLLLPPSQPHVWACTSNLSARPRSVVVRAGKQLILITNSDYHYTHHIMSYAYDCFLPPGQTWRDLFDMVGATGAAPPCLASAPGNLLGAGMVHFQNSGRPAATAASIATPSLHPTPPQCPPTQLLSIDNELGRKV